MQPLLVPQPGMTMHVLPHAHTPGTGTVRYLSHCMASTTATPPQGMQQAHLHVIGHPASIHCGTRSAHSAPQQVRQPLQYLEVFGILERAPATHHNLGRCQLWALAGSAAGPQVVRDRAAGVFCCS